jgi:hypothetical protein
MKGILKETKEGWVVWYVVTIDETTFIKETLPLYPNTSYINLFFGKEVEFEITDEFTHQELYKGVGWGDGIKYAKLINLDLWNDIFESYPETINGSYISLKEWLKQNYNSPIKK